MLILLIPVILTILFALVVKVKQEQILTVLIPTGACVLIYAATYLIMIYGNIDDVEYLHYYIEKVRHEDEWNERVTVTKTRTVIDSNGHSHTETYREKKTVNHPEQWMAFLNNNKQINITKEKYNSIVKLWNVPEKFIDMHRDYYTKDGDAQEYKWNLNVNTIKPYTCKHHYVNKLLGSDSQFKFNDISKDEANELGLYEYPDIIDDEQNPIIGYSKYVTKHNIYSMKRLNAINGLFKEVCTYILIYPNTTSSIAEDQRSYWQGGNKNEFVICVGIDSLSNKVQWTECFSWQDDISLDVSCKNYIMHMNKLDIDKLSIWLTDNMQKWKRKEFSDFDYLNVELSDNQELCLLLIVICVSILSLSIIYIQIKQ